MGTEGLGQAGSSCCLSQLTYNGDCNVTRVVGGLVPVRPCRCLRFMVPRGWLGTPSPAVGPAATEGLESSHDPGQTACCSHSLSFPGWASLPGDSLISAGRQEMSPPGCSGTGEAGREALVPGPACLGCQLQRDQHQQEAPHGDCDDARPGALHAGVSSQGPGSVISVKECTPRSLSQLVHHLSTAPRGRRQTQGPCQGHQGWPSFHFLSWQGDRCDQRGRSFVTGRDVSVPHEPS